MLACLIHVHIHTSLLYFHTNLPASTRYKQESIHASVKGGMKYNTGRLLMVLHKPLIPHKGDEYDESMRGGRGYEEPDMEGQAMLPMP